MILFFCLFVRKKEKTMSFTHSSRLVDNTHIHSFTHFLISVVAKQCSYYFLFFNAHMHTSKYTSGLRKKNKNEINEIIDILCTPMNPSLSRWWNECTQLIFFLSTILVCGVLRFAVNGPTLRTSFFSSLLSLCVFLVCLSFSTSSLSGRMSSRETKCE